MKKQRLNKSILPLGKSPVLKDICDKYNITNYIINDDGSIDVDGDVNLSYRNLTEIPLNFNEVTGRFSCSYNPNLKSLKGAPKECEYFFCMNTAIESLEYAPGIVNIFNCSNNSNLKSLKGAPKKGWRFYSYENTLIKTFDGLEDTIYNYYDLQGTPLNKLYYLYLEPKRIKEFIDLEITDGHSVKIYRLEHFLNRKLTTSEITDIEKDYYLL